jgi:hypothetical protein
VSEFSWRTEWSTIFQQEIARRAIESDVPISRWRAAGKRTQVNPRGEDRAFWDQHGPEYASNWGDFLAEHPDWEMYFTPDGRPGIELYMQPTFGGIAVKAIPDRVYRTPEGLAIVDLKSGARRPNAAYQLPIYKVALEELFGEPVDKCYYFMCRKGELVEDYSPVIPTKAVLDQVFALAKKQIDSGIFLPNAGDNCRRCNVRKACGIVTEG